MLSVDDLDVRNLAADSGTWISLLMPTHRSGPETTSGSIMLKNLLREADEQVDEDQRQRLADTVAPLVSNSRFWQNQGDGLAIFVSDDNTHVHKLSISPEPTARASDAPHLVPLVPIIGRPKDATILQLSLGKVRLFEVSGENIDEVDLGPIPESVDALPTDRDHQVQLQFTSQGGGSVSFHGHGADGSAEEANRERFLREVAQGLAERGSQGEIFVAATQDIAEQFARLSGLDGLSERVIAGSADGLRPAEVLERARPVLDEYAEVQRAGHRETIGLRRSQGRVEEDASQVLQAATEGRVDTLFVGDVADGDVDRVNSAIMETLRNSGEVRARPEDRAGVVAVLRF